MGWKSGAILARVLLALMPALAPVAAPALPAAAHADERERLVLRFQDDRITESSGLAVSPIHQGIIYTHNDSDDEAVCYAVGLDGRTRAVFRLAGVQARDWEGMAASVDKATGKGVLWFADIGDNFDGAWPEIYVYKVIEPEELRDQTLRAVRYRFRYEDGPRNAEGIMVHPGTGRLYIVSKEFAGGIYQAPARLRTDRVNVLRRIASAPIMATDAAYAPDGSSFVIRTYLSATVYRDFDEPIGRVSMPHVEQAESITYTRDGRALLVGSEGKNSPLYEVPLSEELLARAAPEQDAGRAAPEGRAQEPAERSERTERRTRDGAESPASAAAPAAQEEEEDGGALGTVAALWVAVAAGAIGGIVLLARRVG